MPALGCIQQLCYHLQDSEILESFPEMTLNEVSTSISGMDPGRLTFNMPSGYLHQANPAETRMQRSFAPAILTHIYATLDTFRCSFAVGMYIADGWAECQCSLGAPHWAHRGVRLPQVLPRIQPSGMFQGSVCC